MLDTQKLDTYQGRQKSKIICKCGKRGGVLTRRSAGNSSRHRYMYIQHYDPTKKAGKSQCYIGSQNLALVGLSDKRYQTMYKPFIKRLVEFIEDNSLSGPELRKLEVAAACMLIEFGWPDKVSAYVIDKLEADIKEIHVSHLIERYKKEQGKKVTREQVYNYAFKKRDRFKMDDRERKGWNEVSLQGRRQTLKGSRGVYS